MRLYVFAVLIFLSISAFQSTVFYNFCLMFCGFAELLKIIAPGVRFWNYFFAPGGQGFALSLCPGGGEFAHSEKFPGVLPGG